MTLRIFACALRARAVEDGARGPCSLMADANATLLRLEEHPPLTAPGHRTINALQVLER